MEICICFQVPRFYKIRIGQTTHRMWVYLSKLHMIFVLIAKYLCTYYNKYYCSKWQRICANIKFHLLFSQVQRLYEIRITETTQRMWITTDTWRPPDPVISFLITANKEWLQYFLWQKKHQLSSAPLLAYLQLVPNWLESHSNLSRTYWKCAQTICLTSALPHCSENSLLERQTNVNINC